MSEIILNHPYIDRPGNHTDSSDTQGQNSTCEYDKFKTRSICIKLRSFLYSFVVSLEADLDSMIGLEYLAVDDMVLFSLWGTFFGLPWTEMRQIEVH